MKHLKTLNHFLIKINFPYPITDENFEKACSLYEELLDKSQSEKENSHLLFLLDSLGKAIESYENSLEEIKNIENTGFSDVLKFFMENQNITQKELTPNVFKTQERVSKILNKKTEPKLSEIQKCIQFFKIPEKYANIFLAV